MRYNQNSTTLPNKKKKKSSDTVKIIVEDKEIKSPKDKSNHFNEFFCNIGKKFVNYLNSSN